MIGNRFKLYVDCNSINLEGLKDIGVKIFRYPEFSRTDRGILMRFS